MVRVDLLFFSVVFLCSIGVASAGCPISQTGEKAAAPTGTVASKIAMAAWQREHPGFKLEPTDFQSTHLEQGAWHISEAPQAGQRGGGRPEAWICAANGEVIRMNISR
jgi:hypothetical protein